MLVVKSVTLVLLIINYDSNGFNLNPKTRQIIRDPMKNENSFFGYSVAFQKRESSKTETNNPWLVVGSPRSNIGYLNSKEPGDAFKCHTDHKGLCISVMNETMFQGNNQFHQWSHSWIGAVVRTYSYKTSSNVILICGPHYGPNQTSSAHHSLDGICFCLDETSLPQEHKIWSAHVGSHSIYGLSADFVKVRTGWSAVIGNITLTLAGRWTGALSNLKKHWVTGKNLSKNLYLGADSKLEKHLVDTNFFNFNENHSHFGASSKLEKHWVNVDRNFFNDNEKNSYFGYSVTAGESKFRGQIYVVSSPRSGSAGKVGIYKNLQNSYGLMPEIFYHGKQIGEYFGASICILDSNKDGIEDVIVGAPFFAHSEEWFNEGRIGIILSVPDERDQPNYYTKELKGYRYGKPKSGSQFGLSLSVIGDLNQDGLSDIAVGAPYEDDRRGAIYIFLGDKDHGISEHFSQHIQASELDHSLLGFGISMTGEQDVDFNQFDDVGVGSYLSSNVVLLKSSPIIKLRGELNILSEFDGELISVNDKPHLISACVHYEAGDIKTDMAYVKINITVDPEFKRTKSVEINSTSATLKGDFIEVLNSGIDYGSTFCLYFTFQLQEEIKNRNEELSIEMQHFAVSDKRCKKECPMTDPKFNNTTLKLPFRTYYTDLQLSSKFININGSTYMHSSPNKNLLIEVILLNKKDMAIATKLDIEMPSILSVNYNEGDERCKASFTREKIVDGRTYYSCKFRDVKRMETPTIIMHLSTSDLTEKVDELIFNFTVMSSSKDDVDDNNFSSLQLSVHVDTPLFISGFANPEKIIISNTKKDEKDNNFKHDYEVSNKSPMKLTVTVNITVPIPVIISDVERVPMFLLQAKVRLPNDNVISCLNNADENLKKYFHEWHEIPDQNFTKSLAYKLKLKAKNLIKHNFDCNHQAHSTSQSTIALVCVNISCLNFSFKGNATVEVRMRSSDKVFDYLIGPNGMRKFITEARLFLSNSQERFHLSGNQEAAVETLIEVNFHTNPIWPYILAFVLTLVLMIIITYGLYKANFFKRNRVNKDVLNDPGAHSTENLLT